MTRWQLQNAKTHLSELVEDANRKGPQLITRHGAERAVVLSMDEYRSLTLTRKTGPKPNFVEFLLTGPTFDDDVFENLRDNTDTGREIDLDA